MWERSEKWNLTDLVIFNIKIDLKNYLNSIWKKSNRLGQQLKLFVDIGDRWNDFQSILQTPQEMLKQWVKDAKSHIKISYIKRCVLKIADTSLVQIQ